MNRRDFVEAAPTFPGDPRIRLPPASPRRYDGTAMAVFHPHPELTAPRGALEADPRPQVTGEGLTRDSTETKAAECLAPPWSTASG